MQRFVLLTSVLGMVAVTACGGDGHGAIDAAVAIDATVDASSASDAWEGPCNPPLNAGCPEDQRCGAVIQTTTPISSQTTECVTEGTLALGDPCTYDGTVSGGGTGESDCVGGTECLGGECTKICDTTDEESCPAGGTCGPVTDFFDGTTFGFCTPTCEAVGVVDSMQSTGCLAGEGCYVDTFMGRSTCLTEFCDGTSLCTHDATCAYTNACHPGKACVVLNSAADQLLCAKLCIPPVIANGLTEAMLPLDMVAYPPATLNGQAPWDCARVNDGAGQPDDPLAAPQYACIPLGGDDFVRYWSNLTAAEGWPYGSALGVCIDTTSPESDGNPYYDDPTMTVTPRYRSTSPFGQSARDLLRSLRAHPDYRAITGTAEDPK